MVVILVTIFSFKTGIRRIIQNLSEELLLSLYTQDLIDYFKTYNYTMSIIQARSAIDLLKTAAPQTNQSSCHFLGSIVQWYSGIVFICELFEYSLFFRTKCVSPVSSVGRASDF